MSSPDGLRRSHLFAPASSERIVMKALESDADAVVLDLEDSVAASDRPDAHRLLASFSEEIAARPTHVRVGIDGFHYHADDVDLALDLGVEAIRLPKAELPHSAATVAERLDTARSSAVIHLTIESAAGLRRLEELATCAPRVSRMVFGERDFLADLGVDEPGPITDHARGVIAVTSRALGLGTPIDGAFIDLDDDEGLRASCRRARSFGFGGKSALHPRQLDAIHEAFTPTESQLERARHIIAAFDEAKVRGDVTVVVDGRFVDEAVARRARSVLAMVGEDA